MAAKIRLNYGLQTGMTVTMTLVAIYASVSDVLYCKAQAAFWEDKNQNTKKQSHSFVVCKKNADWHNLIGFNILQAFGDSYFLQKAIDLGYCQLIKNKGKSGICSFSLGEMQGRNWSPQQAK